DEHCARFHVLVVGDEHPNHRAAHSRRNRDQMTVHLRVVGRLAAGGDPEPRGGRGEDREAEERGGPQPAPAREGNRRTGVSHQRMPPKTRRAVSSAIPTAWTSAPLARFEVYVAAMN